MSILTYGDTDIHTRHVPEKEVTKRFALVLLEHVDPEGARLYILRRFATHAGAAQCARHLDLNKRRFLIWDTEEPWTDAWIRPGQSKINST